MVENEEKVRYQIAFRDEVSIGAMVCALKYFERNRIDCVIGPGLNSEIIMDVIMTERQNMWFYSEYDWAIVWSKRINEDSGYVYVREKIKDEYL